MVDALAEYLKKRYTELTTPKTPGGEPEVKPEEFVVLEVGGMSLQHFATASNNFIRLLQDQES